MLLYLPSAHGSNQCSIKLCLRCVMTVIFDVDSCYWLTDRNINSVLTYCNLFPSSEGDVVSFHLLQLAFSVRRRLASGQIMYEVKYSYIETLFL